MFSLPTGEPTQINVLDRQDDHFAHFEIGYVIADAIDSFHTAEYQQTHCVVNPAGVRPPAPPRRLQRPRPTNNFVELPDALRRLFDSTQRVNYINNNNVKPSVKTPDFNTGHFNFTNNNVNHVKTVSTITSSNPNLADTNSTLDSSLDMYSNSFRGSFSSSRGSFGFSQGPNSNSGFINTNVALVELLIQECEAMDPLNLLTRLGVMNQDNLIMVFTSRKGCRFLQKRCDESPECTEGVASLIINRELVNCLALDSHGNYIIQLILKSCPHYHTQLLSTFISDIVDLATGRFSSRVVQEAIICLPPDLVKEMLAGMHGNEVLVAQDQFGTHVIQKVFDEHVYIVYEDFVRQLCEPHTLDRVVCNKYGCRVIQKCLETLANEITEDFVPDIINDLVLPLLSQATVYASHEFANYVIQKLLSHQAFERQRDYIIDVVVIGNVLKLSQDKFASHVVETALSQANASYMYRLCNEILDDYVPNERSQSALEVMMLDQFGNYVAQRLLDFVVKVDKGEVAGLGRWMDIFVETVYRNRVRLDHYSSGKKILDRIRECRPERFIRGLQEWSSSRHS